MKGEECVSTRGRLVWRREAYYAGGGGRERSVMCEREECEAGVGEWVVGVVAKREERVCVRAGRA